MALAPPSLTTPTPSLHALAALPQSAGQVVSVLDAKRGNGIEQTVVLRGQIGTVGENQIQVTALMPQDPNLIEDSIKVEQPTETMIGRELDERFPTIRMQPSLVYDRNAYGPFGYAVGKTGKANCLYAWQYIGQTQPLSLADGLRGDEVFPISIRVRLCLAASQQAMVNLVRQLRVSPPNRAGAMPVAYRAAPVYGARTDALSAADGGGLAPVYAGGYARPVPGYAPSQNRFIAFNQPSATPLEMARYAVPPVYDAPAIYAGDDATVAPDPDTIVRSSSAPRRTVVARRAVRTRTARVAHTTRVARAPTQRRSADDDWTLPPESQPAILRQSSGGGGVPLPSDVDTGPARRPRADATSAIAPRYPSVRASTYPPD